MTERDAGRRSRILELRGKPLHEPLTPTEIAGSKSKLRALGVYGVNSRASDAFYDNVLDVLSQDRFNGFSLFMQLHTSAHFLRDGGYYELKIVENQYHDGVVRFMNEVMPGLREHIEEVLEAIAPTEKIAQDAKTARQILREEIVSKGQPGEFDF